VAALLFLLTGEEAGAKVLLERAFPAAFDALAIGRHAPNYAYLLQKEGQTQRAQEMLVRADLLIRAELDRGLGPIPLACSGRIRDAAR
jgi:hypothetical protein